ncbi:MAG: hypothetical protein IJ800_01800 [Clostridia bacterium]|nr:hypothetical protein [Clostridia bacterium]
MIIAILALFGIAYINSLIKRFTGNDVIMNIIGQNPQAFGIGLVILVVLTVIIFKKIRRKRK